MKKYTLWIIIAVLVVSAAVTAYAMRDEPASEHDDANVPRTVEVKDKQGEETTNRLLSDIGTWSVKSCLVLDGEEYDLYATFDDPEKAIENVKEKCPDALTKLRRGSLTLGELSDGNWQRACRINSNVLKQSVTSDCIVDVGLGILVQIDNLCVTAALEVEHAVVVPAVLVITDQQSLGICGQCSLTCSGKSEEDCGILTVHIGVCGAVHGSNALKRQIVVHHGEHTLLHLSAVPCIHNYLLTAGNVERYTGLGIQTKLLEVLNLCLGCVVNNEVRLETLQLILCRLDEHVLNEVCLPCNLYDEADSHTGIPVRAAECINNEQSLVGQLLLSDLLNLCPCSCGHRMVVVLIFIRGPPYGILGIFIHNDILIFRRTSCVDTSHYVYCAKLSNLTPLVTFQFGLGLLFVQEIIRRIVHDFRRSGNAILVQINCCHIIYLSSLM